MKRFKFILWTSIIITYLLILVGAAVRASGSGMGCPDWPKCFGQYIPPTKLSELPSNYKEIFKVEGKVIADFDAFHTWVEYLNRLLGVIEGFAILGLLISAFQIRKEIKKAWYGAIVTFILVLIIGWVGSKVVSSNLAPAKITLHMILALVMSFVLVGMLYTTRTDQSEERKQPPKILYRFLAFYFWVALLQILLGTQVRQQVDDIATKLQNTHREVWVENLDTVFTFHKWIAASLLFSFIGAFLFWKKKIDASTRQLMSICVVVVALEFILGDMLNLWMPALVQPFHLLFANIFIGLLFYLLMHINTAAWLTRKENLEKN